MLKAIIVDDEKWARSIIRSFGQWTKLGIEIVGEGEDGLEGLDLIEKVKPDIIITDMEMSNMDGVDFLKSIKEKALDAKVIVISGHDNFTYMKQAIKSQAIEYLLKPIDANELNKALENCVKELALSKNMSVLALHDLFDQAVIEEIIDINKELRVILSGTDQTKLTPILEKLRKKMLYIDKDQGLIVRLIHDYIVPILRDEMMDVLKNNDGFHSLFEQTKVNVKKGMLINDYFQSIETLTSLGLVHRYEQIKSSEKPIAELAKDYINLAYREMISLNDIAERFFISKEYLSSTFKAKYGITIGNYILKKKMEEAIRLLNEGDSHKSVAEQLGYKDTTYFYKVFKRYYGTTPGDYHQ